MSNKRTALKAAVLFCSLTLCSCAHYRCDPMYAGPQPRRAELLEYYSYPRQAIEPKVEKTEEKKDYVIRKMSFPSAVNVFSTENIRFDYYVQKKRGKFPTAIVLPIAGGADFSVRSFAKYFASRGFNCAIIHNRKAHLDNAKSGEVLENYFRQTVLDARQVLDYLVERQEVDADKLGCLGLSLGGIKAALVCGVDERLKCAVMGVAGGSIADIAVASREKQIKAYIRELVRMGVSEESIHAELSEKVKTDPINLAGHIDARNVLMFIAAFDRVVPTKCGDRLRQAMGKPEVIYLFSGHYGSFLYLPYAEQESLSFFKKKFSLR